MAANAARTQKRALDFYKQKGRAPKVPAPAPNPTRAKGSRTTLPRMPGTVAKPQGLKPGALAARGEVKPVASKLRPGKRITIKTKRTPKPTKQDKAFESVMNLKGVTDFSRGKQRQVWIDAKMMTLSRRKKLGLSGIRAESDRYYAREDINPTTRMPGYFMGTRSGWLNSQPKTRQGVIKRPRRSRRPRNS
jgi:hypothetical protein